VICFDYIEKTMTTAKFQRQYTLDDLDALLLTRATGGLCG
jgi:hypothetical protein